MLGVGVKAVMVSPLFFFHLFSSFTGKNRSPPPLKVSIICRIFLLGMLSCSVQTCLFTGIAYSSPTLASAIIDLTPAFTFILAIISRSYNMILWHAFRMEKLDLRVKSSLGKSIGTMVLIAGALIVTLYNGPAIILSSSSLSNLNNEFLSLQKNWVIGGLLLAAGSFLVSLLYIVQTSIVKEYPEELMVTFIGCVFATFQTAILALILERNPNSWTLRADMELIAILYSAVFGVALGNLVHTWACHKKGTVYVSMFKPVGIVIAAVMGVTLLGDTLYLGSIIGASIIAFGFYSVLWGQAQEEKMVDDKGINCSKSSSPNAPLLENRSMEI
ncbi:hypothetical protein Patl1_16200 [Pistacia atlantica]|uniref:Uncharacterized protein n=1 Tax=Pistacia atlantica TaxID=434234 RepID=A0ACC1BA82_9ROSI|nr:hypothetical protein Patl1_16200 [Pistacia atlantica]